MKVDHLLPLTLGGLTVLACAALLATHWVTKEPIAEQEAAAVMRALDLLMPQSLYDNDLMADAWLVTEPSLGHRKEETIYLGYLNEELSVVAIPVVAQDGYSGDIQLMVGVHITAQAFNQITAVEVVSHKETPGLGDLIERRKGDWLNQFNQSSLTQPNEALWLVKKDGGHFDQITGATITPRAVVAAVKKALQYVHNQQSKWTKQEGRLRVHHEQ